MFIFLVMEFMCMFMFVSYPLAGDVVTIVDFFGLTAISTFVSVQFMTTMVIFEAGIGECHADCGSDDYILRRENVKDFSGEHTIFTFSNSKFTFQHLIHLLLLL